MSVLFYRASFFKTTNGFIWISQNIVWIRRRYKAQFDNGASRWCRVYFSRSLLFFLFFHFKNVHFLLFFALNAFNCCVFGRKWRHNTRLITFYHFYLLNAFIFFRVLVLILMCIYFVVFLAAFSVVIECIVLDFFSVCNFLGKNRTQTISNVSQFQSKSYRVHVYSVILSRENKNKQKYLEKNE